MYQPTEGYDSTAAAYCGTCGVHTMGIWVAHPLMPDSIVMCVQCAAASIRTPTGPQHPYQLIPTQHLRVHESATHINEAIRFFQFLLNEHKMCEHYSQSNGNLKGHDQFKLPDISLIHTIPIDGGVIWEPTMEGVHLNAIIQRLNIQGVGVWSNLMQGMEKKMRDTTSMIEGEDGRLLGPGSAMPTMSRIFSGHMYAKFSMDSLHSMENNVEPAVLALKSELLHVVHMLHQDFPSTDMPGEFTITVAEHKLRATMLMIGGVGTGTGLHTDWTNALNFAFALTDGKKTTAMPVIGETPVALWAFINPLPTIMARVSAWLADPANMVPGYPHGIQPSDWSKLRADESFGTLPPIPIAIMKRMQAALPEGDVVLAHQHHGCLMNAPVGWPHAVTNLAPCAKIAFDFIRMEDMPKIALSHQCNIVGYFRQHSALDYTDAFTSSFQHALHVMAMIKHAASMNKKPK